MELLLFYKELFIIIIFKYFVEKNILKKNLISYNFSILVVLVTIISFLHICCNLLGIFFKKKSYFNIKNIYAHIY